MSADASWDEILDASPVPSPLRRIVGHRGVRDILECGHDVLSRAPQRRTSTYRPEMIRRRCARCAYKENAALAAGPTLSADPMEQAWRKWRSASDGYESERRFISDRNAFIAGWRASQQELTK